MRTCTIEQAKASAALIRKAIEQAEQLSEERRVVRVRLSATWKEQDRGSDEWEQRHNRIQALYDELSTAFDKAISRANSMIADMATMAIIEDSTVEALSDVAASASEILREAAESNGVILATVEMEMMDKLESDYMKGMR